MTLRRAVTMNVKCFRASRAGSVRTDLTKAIRPQSQEMQSQVTDSRDSHSTSLKRSYHNTCHSILRHAVEVAWFITFPVSAHLSMVIMPFLLIYKNQLKTSLI